MSYAGAGGGAASRLFGVYKLPYEAGDLEIVSLSGDGIARIRYKGERIILKPGQERQLLFRQEIIRLEHNGVLFEETTVSVIRNLGLWEKREIQFLERFIAICP